MSKAEGFSTLYHQVMQLLKSCKDAHAVHVTKSVASWALNMLVLSDGIIIPGVRSSLLNPAQGACSLLATQQHLQGVQPVPAAGTSQTHADSAIPWSQGEFECRSSTHCRSQLATRHIDANQKPQ